MPGVDWIPGVSQLKTVCQLVTGDAEGAARTQENFWKECPIFSQVTSTVQLIAGDTEGAKETQRRCVGTINNVANGIPVVGHIKGCVHHVLGDHEGGNQALQAATRSSVILGTGVAVGLASGGIGAVPAAISVGCSYDSIDSAISKKPKGILAALTNVADNPNAGTVFDAASYVAGDALAGCSGGHIRYKVPIKGKINIWEFARDVKKENLTSALSHNSLTSGLRYYDEKTINVSNKDGGSNTEENGLEDDFYSGVVVTALSSKQRKQKKANYVLQKPEEYSIKKSSIYTNKNWEELQESINQDNDPEKNLPKKPQEQIGAAAWMHVQMPQEFGYTGAILVNNTFQGLLHTFFRHWDQWLEYIPDLRNLMDNLPKSLRRLMRNVHDADNRESSREAINQLNEELKKLKSETNINAVLLEIQRKLHEFLEINVTSRQYLGEGITDRGQIQVYFQVSDTDVMVVCVSRQLYASIGDFNDDRPLRTITTVFFQTSDEYEDTKSKIGVGKAWSK